LAQSGHPITHFLFLVAFRFFFLAPGLFRTPQAFSYSSMLMGSRLRAFAMNECPSAFGRNPCRLHHCIKTSNSIISRRIHRPKRTFPNQTSRSTITSISSSHRRHSSVCRSRYCCSGSIHARRMIAPHMGHAGRSSILGSPIAEVRSIEISPSKCDPEHRK